METFWYSAVTFMLAVYVVLDGYDFGVGMLYPFIARTEGERRMALAAIGPVWSGNEVWLIAGGAVLFLAFPRAYAAGFSGFYLALIIVLWLLIGRGLAIELRKTSHHRLIILYVPVAKQFHEIGGHVLDIFQGVRPVGMPAQLHFLPAGKAFSDLLPALNDQLIQLCNLVRVVDLFMFLCMF